MSRFLAIGWLLVVCCSCSQRIAVPPNAVVVFEDVASNREAKIPEPLAGQLRTLLNQTPHKAEPGVSMPLDTRKYLRVGDQTLQVFPGSLVLMDDWGVRTWQLANVATQLEAHLPAGGTDTR